MNYIPKNVSFDAGVETAGLLSEQDIIQLQTGKDSDLEEDTANGSDSPTIQPSLNDKHYESS